MEIMDNICWVDDCGQSFGVEAGLNDTVFPCVPADDRGWRGKTFLDNFLDDCICLPPSNSISLCVIYQTATAISMLGEEVLDRVPSCIWQYCLKPSGRPLCGSAYVQNMKRFESWKTDWLYIFLLPFKEWNSADLGAEGVWGEGESGWKGVF